MITIVPLVVRLVTCDAIFEQAKMYVMFRLLRRVSVSHTVLHHLAVPPTQLPWTEMLFSAFRSHESFHCASLSNTEAQTCTQQDETSASPVFSRSAGMYCVCTPDHKSPPLGSLVRSGIGQSAVIQSSMCQSKVLC